MVALVACSRNGYVCCPSLHRDHTIGEALRLLARIRGVAMIWQDGYGADAAKNNYKSDYMQAFQEVKSLRHVYRLEPASEKATTMLAGIAPACGDGEAVRSDANQVVYLAFTSGTTGTPKAVMHSDNTLLANARQIAADWSIGSTSVIFSLQPLSHNLGFGAQVMALAVGGELVINDLPRGESLADRIVETETSFLVGVPPNAIDLLAEMKKRELKGLGRLTGFRISGSAVPSEVVAALIEQGITPQSGYGMTENCSHQYTLPDDTRERIIETSGKTCPGYELRIFKPDDPDTEAPPGEIGQIGGRGASLMLGYFDDQAATEDAFNKDGWFMTGDLGTLDSEGYLRIAGRSKDIIIRGGHNIHPARIEELATRHPAVKRAAAVPVKDSRLGRRSASGCGPPEGRAITPEDLLAHLDATGLSKYDMPEYYLASTRFRSRPMAKCSSATLSTGSKMADSNRSRSASRGAPAIKEKQCMRAVVVREFGGIEKAALEDVPAAAPKAGEILIKVHAVSVNFVDLLMINGSYQFKPSLPFIPGKLPVGIVTGAGDGVTNFRIGDHALLMAEERGFAEFAVMPEDQCIRLPHSLTFDEAASMALVYDTAYFALKDRGRIAPDETVLVLGATGGVGLAAIQLAKAMGAKVLAAVSSKDKQDMCAQAAPTP